MDGSDGTHKDTEDTTHWLCEFGDDGNDTRCVKQFNLDHHKWEDYHGTRFYNKDCDLVINRCLNRVEKDTSGLMFQEWTPDVDTVTCGYVDQLQRLTGHWMQAQGSADSNT